MWHSVWFTYPVSFLFQYKRFRSYVINGADIMVVDLPIIVYIDTMLFSISQTSILSIRHCQIECFITAITDSFPRVKKVRFVTTINDWMVVGMSPDRGNVKYPRLVRIRFPKVWKQFNLTTPSPYGTWLWNDLHKSVLTTHSTPFDFFSFMFVVAKRSVRTSGHFCTSPNSEQFDYTSVLEEHIRLAVLASICIVCRIS